MTMPISGEGRENVGHATAGGGAATVSEFKAEQGRNRADQDQAFILPAQSSMISDVGFQKDNIKKGGWVTAAS